MVEQWCFSPYGGRSLLVPEVLARDVSLRSMQQRALRQLLIPKGFAPPLFGLLFVKGFQRIIVSIR
jgi:hypothetical protein